MLDQHRNMFGLQSFNVTNLKPQFVQILDAAKKHMAHIGLTRERIAFGLLDQFIDGKFGAA